MHQSFRCWQENRIHSCIQNPGKNTGCPEQTVALLFLKVIEMHKILFPALNSQYLKVHKLFELLQLSGFSS